MASPALKAGPLASVQFLRLGGRSLTRPSGTLSPKGERAPWETPPQGLSSALGDLDDDAADVVPKAVGLLRRRQPLQRVGRLPEQVGQLLGAGARMAAHDL